ncbi:hypothetical protein RQ479_29520 [Mesorhizobium sp. ISC25]|uniref:hypothetical protein n=1 Tax=Mesorhizobium sp. ISC25 TaxID=3077335 RepID=UPI0035DEA642
MNGDRSEANRWSAQSVPSQTLSRRKFLKVSMTGVATPVEAGLLPASRASLRRVAPEQRQSLWRSIRMFQTKVAAAQGAPISWSRMHARSSRAKSALMAGAAFTNRGQPDRSETSGRGTSLETDQGITWAQRNVYSARNPQCTSNIAAHPIQPMLIPFLVAFDHDILVGSLSGMDHQFA